MSLHDLSYGLKVFKATQTLYIGDVGEGGNEKTTFWDFNWFYQTDEAVKNKKNTIESNFVILYQKKLYWKYVLIRVILVSSIRKFNPNGLKENSGVTCSLTHVTEQFL